MSTFSPGAALAGLAFAAAGLLFLLEELDVVALRPEVIGPALLIALGLAAILGTLTNRNRT